MTSAPTPDSDARRSAWETAYDNKQNFVFYPEEEVVRFVSRHLRQRQGLDTFRDVVPNAEGLTFLDAGCGIGRHLKMALSFGFDPYGFDLSDSAVAVARDWLGKSGLAAPDSRIIQADIRDLPYETAFFDCVISHAVLDSMPTAIARDGIAELARVLKPGGLFFCDFIGGGDHEEVITTEHEKGTLQSFFTPEKIDALLPDGFELIERVRTERTTTRSAHVHSRLHVTLRRL
ncbi:class I SAM-dependent methyltransferase [Pyruvatibacter mobilis]|uniref:class I SAM-dependent methyltransferase n=1 Tax=Pyruvatibacter mobilis TaxID=1712261 RepID=UPI003BA9BBD3